MHWSWQTWPLTSFYDCALRGSWGTFHWRVASITHLFSLPSSTEPTSTSYSEIGEKELWTYTHHSSHKTLSIAVDFRIRFWGCFPAFPQQSQLNPAPDQVSVEKRWCIEVLPPLSMCIEMEAEVDILLLWTLFPFCLRGLLDGLL